jgi:hypothetical protein
MRSELKLNEVVAPEEGLVPNIHCFANDLEVVSSEFQTNQAYSLTTMLNSSTTGY